MLHEGAQSHAQRKAGDTKGDESDDEGDHAHATHSW